MGIDDKLATLRAALDLVRDEAAKPDALPHWRELVGATERGLCALVANADEERDTQTNAHSDEAFRCCCCDTAVAHLAPMWWDETNEIRSCCRGCGDVLSDPDTDADAYRAAGWDLAKVPVVDVVP
jgi:hypothetical protein